MVDLDNEQSLETSPKKEKERKARVDQVILHNLSKQVQFPSDVIKADAINVYGDRWRVNLWTIGDNNARVEQSYFVVADAQGGIVSYS